MKRPEVKVPIPEGLKAQLVDDWENVTKNQQVCPPRVILFSTLYSARSTFSLLHDYHSRFPARSCATQAQRCEDSRDVPRRQEGQKVRRAGDVCSFILHHEYSMHSLLFFNRSSSYPLTPTAGLMTSSPRSCRASSFISTRLWAICSCIDSSGTSMSRSARRTQIRKCQKCTARSTC